MEPPTPEPSSSMFNELSRDQSQKELASSLETLTLSKILTLKKTWGTLSQAEGLGTKIFLNLFDIAPETLDYFSFRNSNNLEANPALHAHGRKVVAFFTTALSHIDNLKSVLPLFSDLG
mmetsp:Transcript_12390/g.19311  ORF Transcript_12390/g.19311 Transcript_12390/m.19311 type:complete len:119 (+) Transcript_12390:1620-1976(+)